MMSLSQKWTMTLAELVADFVATDSLPNLSVEGIALDSRQVQPGDLFIAVKGTAVDGAKFIPQAIEQGAVAVLVEQDQLSDDFIAAVPVIGLERLSEYVSDIAGVFFGHPSARMQLTAITGTNGKTTCSRLLAELKEGMGVDRAAFIGTLGYGMVRDAGCQDADLADRAYAGVKDTGLTTPNAVAMQRILAELASRGANSVALEVSSHSLVQRRVAGLKIDTAVFTNLSRDHLDYHGDINAYAAAKSRLFAMGGLQQAVINIDDSVGRAILANLSSEIRGISFSLENAEADIYCSTIGLSPEGLRASVITPWGQGEISSPLLGKFNLANLLAVIGAAAAQGFALESILQTIPSLRAVPGRMELVDSHAEPAVVVDYAHTPDALEKALEALRVHCLGQLWVVFGCGGDRDIGKRAEMGEIAQRCADQTVVTSDNPRTESAEQIIEHILQGTSRHVIVESDRRAAIRQAVFSADKNDVVLIAGKGHESYQILGAERLPFSDQAEARLALRDLEQQRREALSGGAK